GNDASACLEAVQAAIGVRHEIDGVDCHGIRHALLRHDCRSFGCGLCVGSAVIAQRGGVVHQPVHGDVVALGDFVVVEVVRAGDLYCAGAELLVRIFVGDD